MNASHWKALFDRVLVLSLPASRERRVHISRHLPQVGLDEFEFFDATASDDPVVAQAFATGDVLTYPPCFRCGELDCGSPDCNNFLLPAQVAVFLSYRRLWRAVEQGHAARVLVLEDDVHLHPHAPKVLERIAEEAAASRIPFLAGRPCLLRLGWALCQEHSQPADAFRTSTELRMSNPCHALTREYAAALLARDIGINHTVDVYQHSLAPEPGEAWTIFPPIASELSWTEGVFPSTIHPKAVHSQHLRAMGREEAAVSNDRYVRHHVKKKHYRPLLVTGHPRCGTGYASSLCRQLGLDVGHERLGEHGISSWMFAVEADENPYALDAVARTRRAFAWHQMVMPVRDLASAVGSVVRDSIHAPPSYAFRRTHILRLLGVDLDTFATPLERALWSVTSWCRIVLKQQPALVWRIEDEHENLRHFLVESGIAPSQARNLPLDTSPVNADKPYQGVRQPKPKFGQDHWRSLPAHSLAEAAWYCEEFGYKMPV